MAMETVYLEHVPNTHHVYAAFFKDVSNPEFLQAQLLARNPDFEYAFIDASSILSRLQILAATFKALAVQLSGTLRTPNVHSEIVWALSASNNISQAYRRWGLSPSTKDIIVIKIVFPTDTRPTPLTADDVWAHLMANVKGRLVGLTDAEIVASTDWPKVRKYYKLNGLKALKSFDNAQGKVGEMSVLTMGGMAIKGL